ncbi:MAG: class I SAM-dependent methyltransferase [Myxococcales bacterium]|nr:class I SAM-dependent methyltransferase [Myxococcales bacterium]
MTPPVRPNPATQTDATEALREHWDTRARASTSDLDRVDTSARSQRWRFDMFARFNSVADASVLDVGCGVGDFYAYLRAEFPSATYDGVDISSAMIERARSLHPGANFSATDVLAARPERRWDFVVAFGVHNVQLPGAETLLWDLLTRQFELCDVAAHVSLLTDRFGGFGPTALPWDPAEVLRRAFALTPYVSLRHDYLPHDFSLTLYREPLADRSSPWATSRAGVPGSAMLSDEVVR